MATERPARRLKDVLENIARIRDHVGEMSEAEYHRDLKTMDAVERCFERIAEAMRKLGDQYDSIYLDVNLPKLRQFGSILRHDYDRLSPPHVWQMVLIRLDPLETMAKTELAKLDASNPLE